MQSILGASLIELAALCWHSSGENVCRASYRIFSWGGGELFFFNCRKTMWLIDHSEGEGVGGVCVLSHAACSAEAYCLIPFLTVRFTLWTNKGNAIMSSTGTATFYFKNKISAGGGEYQGPPPSV